MRGTCIAVVFAMVAGGATMARADVNPTPISLPLLGTQGAAGPYPSTIEVEAPGGPGHESHVNVMLWGVTHPCPRDLAILLVDDDNVGYLLMSNAGACRPMQGTNLHFVSLAPTVLPSDPSSSPPWGEFIHVRPSNYGTQPVFPAPAPPGPYLTNLPGNINLNGQWSLYVIDTQNENRGVAAGGWSLEYNTRPQFPALHEDVRVPGSGTGPGNAEFYPLNFDLTRVPSQYRVHRVELHVTLHHTLPDNLRLALQSPEGTTVILMANAGGTTDISPGSTLRFADDNQNPVPDNSAIVNVNYRPGGAYTALIALGAPAPQPPYETAFSAMQYEDVRGVWRLWAYDDAAGEVGEIESAMLEIAVEPTSAPDFTFDFGPPPVTVDQPFVRFFGNHSHAGVRYAYTWRNVVDGEFFDAGVFAASPTSTLIEAFVPMKKGTNVVRIWGHPASGPGSLSTQTFTVNEFTYSLAEGATGGFFDLDVTLANPSAAAAPVAIDFLAETGGVVHLAENVAANSPLPINVETYLPATAMSTIVHSTDAVPLAVERTMSWDARGYGGHGGTAVEPSTRWLFAEGSQGFFQTYVLLANDNASAVDVTVDFLLEGGGVTSVPVSVSARSRYTLYAGDIPQLVDRSFGIDVTASLPIIAERAMYLPGPHLFEGGHESAGVNRASRNWFLAEGATGPFFDCFVLLSNPSSALTANVTLTYLLPSGATVTQNVVMPARSRLTINVETVDAQLTNTPVSTAIASDVSIVAERAMYWPDAGQGWQEAHNSFGVTHTALRWGVADGRIGGPRAHQTYILLANPNPQPAEVEVRFLRAASPSISRFYTLAPTSRLNIWANGDVPELSEGAFSAEVRVLNYQPIAVEKALYWDADGVTWAGGTNVTATRLPPP